MSSRSALLLILVLAACGSPGPVSGQALPSDVAIFVERRDACDHFRNEEPYDAARAAELKFKLEQTCAGTDRELASLRRKYAADPRVIDRLSRYEGPIE